MNQLQKIIQKRNEFISEVEKLKIGTKLKVIEEFYHVKSNDILEIVDVDEFCDDYFVIKVTNNKDNDGFWLTYGDLEYIEIIEE